jgi:hypothetical protein
MAEQIMPSGKHPRAGTILCKICQALDLWEELFEVFRSNRIYVRNVFVHFFCGTTPQIGPSLPHFLGFYVYIIRHTHPVEFV